ncbi:transcriptional regulator with XRE-family HTH domain [Nocardiopsis mwathae]|uniref:Transcriptional regulator with XRE-family HTH domain n=1 Tax=Nocardiopsis mwathae TaxID=1472723 RepID=A0A7W9YHM9_9ACTN|nr:helix-turn-helix transcriptional regulator [Nocardiopsis mwathae]MBB6172259.1 transcriptional regulator with XRE-family HTH domain [Nocardiopsis mwathae]
MPHPTVNRGPLDLAAFDPDALHHVRRKRGIPMRSLAERVGYSASHLYKVEEGERPISRQIYAAVIAALDLQPGALLTKEGANRAA